MSHAGDTNDEQQQQHSIQQATQAMSLAHHTPGSPAPLTPTSQDNDHHREDEGDFHDHEAVIDLLFQNVVFYISPFLGKAKVAEVESLLCQHGAMKTQMSLNTGDDNDAWGTTASHTTHIIANNLDIPDYKHAVARGIHMVTLPDYDRNIICDALDTFGGTYTANVDDNKNIVTHMIALSPSGPKYEYVMAHPELNIKVVLPHWFQLCCNSKRRMPETMFQFPDPPMQEVDSDQFPPPGDASAPQLYSNTVRPVLNFLNSPNENQDRFLADMYIYMADDLTILPELRVKMEERIRQAGGTLVDEYSSEMVDIVICRFRAGDVYFAASHDGKIVGSLDWLYHVLFTGTVPSPQASLLHYPIPHDPIPSMTSLVMTVSNYTGSIREYLKRMIVAMGATYKPTLSKGEPEPTTHIICGDPTGEKYQKGNEWNVKVVNHFWLEDCYLSWCLQSETKQRYGLFPINSQLPLVFGIGISPEILEEWTSPEMFETTTQGESTEAGDEVMSARVESVTTSSSLPEEMAPGEFEHHDQDQHMQEESHAKIHSERQSSVGPTATEDVDAGSSTPLPRRPASRRSSSSSVSGITTLASSVISPLEIESSTAGHAIKDSAMPGSHSPGGVRVVSRRRGAALEASKALQQIVPDMNEFQEELRDEKRRKKRGKTAPIDEPKDNDDAMDVDAEETETSASSRKAPASPAKRKRTSMGAVVVQDSAKVQDDAGNESEDATAAGMKTPVKRSKRTVKADKEKESAAVAESTDAMDISMTTAPSKTKQVRYISTGLKDPSAKQVKALKALGIVSTTAMDQCTHLVAKNVARTEKFLVALTQGKIIVHEDWLQACIDANAVLDENEYQIKDTENETKFGMNLYESLERAREKKVFEDCVFYISPSTVPKLASLKVLVEAGGGKATALLQTGLGFLKEKIVKTNNQRKLAAKKDEKARNARNKSSSRKKEDDDDEESDEESDEEENEILAVVSCEDDKDMWQPILDVGAQVYSHELIIAGILRQTLDLGRTHALA
ncbi:hypothetical protein BGX23_010955 [Mortierella sp. AD031]|nr:hypothetical protein BGX23_010955 [Mortierella sp. AD031]